MKVMTGSTIDMALQSQKKAGTTLLDDEAEQFDYRPNKQLLHSNPGQRGMAEKTFTTLRK